MSAGRCDRLRIDVIIDTICPWCFVGKRRLERALAERPGTSAEIFWRPFLLNPDMPPAGLDRDTYLLAKFGSGNRMQRVFGAVRRAGLAVGIPFDFDRISHTPATIDSHRTIRFADSGGRQTEMLEALFMAYFTEGADIGESDVLVDIARRQGLDADHLRAHLRTENDIVGVFNDNARAHRIGVNGVPCFIFNERFALAGAQDVEVLLRLIDLAVEAGPSHPISTPSFAGGATG